MEKRIGVRITHQGPLCALVSQQLPGRGSPRCRWLYRPRRRSPLPAASPLTALPDATGPSAAPARTHRGAPDAHAAPGSRAALGGRGALRPCPADAVFIPHRTETPEQPPKPGAAGQPHENPATRALTRLRLRLARHSRKPWDLAAWGRRSPCVLDEEPGHRPRGRAHRGDACGETPVTPSPAPASVGRLWGHAWPLPAGVVGDEAAWGAH